MCRCRGHDRKREKWLENGSVQKKGRGDMDAIRIENMTKYYGKARGIQEVSLTVSEGEFFGFIGPNGAGKSTTIRTLLGLIKPDRKSVV